MHGTLLKRIVVASSDKAYGETESLPYTEDTPLRGSSPYDVSKSCADLLAHTYYRTYGLPVAIARCGNIFGGGDLNWSRVVPGTILSLLKGESPDIRSDGTNLRDYLYVKDAVEGYLALLGRIGEPGVTGQAFNFGPGKPTSVVKIVELLRGLMRRMDLTPRILNTARGEIREQWLDAAKAGRILKWTPRYSLEDGLRETIRWYQEWYTHSEQGRSQQGPH